MDVVDFASADATFAALIALIGLVAVGLMVGAATAIDKWMRNKEDDAER